MRCNTYYLYICICMHTSVNTVQSSASGNGLVWRESHQVCMHEHLIPIDCLSRRLSSQLSGATVSTNRLSARQSIVWRMSHQLSRRQLIVSHQRHVNYSVSGASVRGNGLWLDNATTDVRYRVVVLHRSHASYVTLFISGNPLSIPANRLLSDKYVSWQSIV